MGCCFLLVGLKNEIEFVEFWNFGGLEKRYGLVTTLRKRSDPNLLEFSCHEKKSQINMSFSG